VIGAVGGFDIAAVGASLLEELLDPQPLIVETNNINASGANAEIALDLNTITTRSYLL
jgi:hypothetical protein